MPNHHDEWYTQRFDYTTWCLEYNVYPKLDVAASDEWHVCKPYYTKKDNALTKKWLEDFWMNPPLLGGNTRKFTTYAFDQAFENKVNGLCLIPAGVISRQWFRPIWREFIDSMTVRGLEGRVLIDPINRPSFHDHGKPIGQQARNDYIMLVLRGR